MNSLETKTESSQDAATFLEHTKKWIEIRNRGGLITVNDRMFSFTRLVENSVGRKHSNLEILKTLQRRGPARCHCNEDSRKPTYCKILGAA